MPQVAAAHRQQDGTAAPLAVRLPHAGLQQERCRQLSCYYAKGDPSNPTNSTTSAATGRDGGVHVWLTGHGAHLLHNETRRDGELQHPSTRRHDALPAAQTAAPVASIHTVLSHGLQCTQPAQNTQGQPGQSSQTWREGY